MDFGFNADQEMLRATARKFLENECTSEFVRARMAEDAGFTPEFWTKLAEQGWLGLVYPEAYGGAGLGFVDLTVLMEEMGRAVMPGPFFSTLLGGLAILEAGSDAQKKEWITKVAEGEARVTLAWTEPSARWDAAGITTAAKASAGGFTLSGTKLNDVSVPAGALLGQKDGGWAPLARVLERATVALCAEMCGGAQKVLDMTTEYAKIRIAFGKRIGSYQGVKHKAADRLAERD